jgi:outer membrane protein OmpA-like peptidoglycan-associated protein
MIKLISMAAQMKRILLVASSLFVLSQPFSVKAQELLPRDPAIMGYHSPPNFRESESHPLRVAAYVLHPVGWLAREVIFRPLSWFASSTPTRRDVLGYRYADDYQEPSCYEKGGDVPDCRSISPFDYIGREGSLNKAGDSDSGLDDENGGRGRMLFPHVNFDFDKASLNDSGRAQVARVVEGINTKEETKGGVALVLEGHADDVGTEEYNMVLGKKRAEAVKNELEKLGIEGSRLRTVSFGEGRPFETGDTPQIRAANRRVEVQID